MAYRYPSVLPGGDCGAGACSSNSRPCTPNKKIIKTLTLDFDTDADLKSRYVVSTGTSLIPANNFFFTVLSPTGVSGVVPGGSLLPSTSNLVSAEYYDATHGKTTEGALFSAAFQLNATGAPAGYSPVLIHIPTGVFATSQRNNGPTGTFVVYYI